MNQQAARQARRQRGLTLVESCVAMCVAAVAVGSVAPNLAGLRERRTVEAAAAQLETDFQHARSLAVARNESVRVSFGNAAACYVVHTGDAGDCRCSADGSASCTGTARSLRSAALGGSRLTLQSNSGSMLFDAVKGTVTPTATVKIAAAGGATLHTVVNVMGRVRSCSPTGGFPGQPAC